MENYEKQKEQLFLDQKKTFRTSPLLRQIFVSLAPLILYTTSGMALGYSAILLPQLENTNSTTINITTNEGSWIASLFIISSAIGCLIAGYFMERIGRKPTQITSGIIFAIGWTLTGAAQNIEMILVARFIAGISFGLTGPTSNMYIGEMTAPKYRGILLSGISVGIAIGLFLSHLLGTFWTWQVVAYLSVSLPCLAIVMMIFVPESPIWLINKGRTEEAQKAFIWCRGYAIEASEELSALLKKDKTIAQEKISWSHCKKREFLEPLIVLTVMVFVMQLAGVNAIVFYTVSLMQNVVGVNMNEYTAMLIIDTIRLIMSVVACVLVRKFGRRPLNNLSVVGTATSLFALSGFLYCSKMFPELSKYSFVPIVCFVSYIIFVTVGLVQLPWVMAGEVFSRRLKSVGGPSISIINLVAMFLVVKTSPIMNLHFQQYGTFFVYGCCTVIGGIFLYLYLPETKGKTLQQIEESFATKQGSNQPQNDFAI